MKKIIGLAFLICNLQTWAQVTKVGNDTLIDVAGWNVEWFGDASEGPSNEPLQYTNVKSVIQNTDIDVWGLAEVSNTSTFLNLVADLTAYDGVNSDFSQTQKMALLWKKNKFTKLSSGNVLTGNTYSYAFASRPPLEVVLKTTDSLSTDTIYFYVVHLKANASGDNQPNYDRRKNAVGFLRTFLETDRKGKKCIVLGDWNDDVDQSVVKVSQVYLETPFIDFVKDSANYLFATMPLSKAGLTSYPNFNPPNMIDHQLMSKPLKDSFFVTGSGFIMSQTASQISGYTNNTSDHYPVLARYNFNRITTSHEDTTHQDTTHVGLSHVLPLHVYIYPNPANHTINIVVNENITNAYLMDMRGRSIDVKIINNQTLNVSEVPAGLYILSVRTEQGKQAISRILIKHDD
jgi:endonuclease/exonuclease/phosphatase family metal-dependent hydrolase